MAKKRTLDDGTIFLTEQCSAIIMNKLPTKLRDPGSFSIPCTIGNLTISKALCDLGASVSILPLSIANKLGLNDLKLTRISLQLADRSIRKPVGVLENVLMKVKHLFIPIDFIVLEIAEDSEIPIILGRPFLATAGVIIDVRDGKLTLRVGEEKIEFNLFESTKFYDLQEKVCSIDVIDEVTNDFYEKELNKNVITYYDGLDHPCTHLEPCLNDETLCDFTDFDKFQQKPTCKPELKSHIAEIRKCRAEVTTFEGFPKEIHSFEQEKESEEPDLYVSCNAIFMQEMEEHKVKQHEFFILDCGEDIKKSMHLEDLWKGRESVKSESLVEEFRSIYSNSLFEMEGSVHHNSLFELEESMKCDNFYQVEEIENMEHTKEMKVNDQPNEALEVNNCEKSEFVGGMDEQHISFSVMNGSGAEYRSLQVDLQDDFLNEVNSLMTIMASYLNIDQSKKLFEVSKSKMNKNVGWKSSDFEGD